MNVTLEELAAFIAVVDTGSITAGAEQLGQTTSGVSRALHRLEHKLGTTLLRRTTRRHELSDEGRTFLDHARTIVACVDEAEEAMALSRQRPAGRLRINAAPSFMRHVITPLIGEFRKAWPDITLELDTNDRIIDLLEHRTDLAIRIGTLKDSSLHARALGVSRLRLVASPDYLTRHGCPATVNDLSHHTMMGFSQLPQLNRWPLHDAHGEELDITPVLSASSGDTLRTLALEGQGIVCLADFMTRQDLEDGRLVEVLAAKRLDRHQSIQAVYYRNTQLSRRIRVFLDFLGERLDGRL
ncbi:LysR family transcriptional regulator [uncultured Kushneria sp.]|uniref:LysR family transcriptional regulator n=1 Tax=uncultured Kushneria sp. TaxID=905033 RepID=UPI0026091D6D|nr:LysR family transcriptional regulator [uncultured Kushneria sp.]